MGIIVTGTQNNKQKIALMVRTYIFVSKLCSLHIPKIKIMPKVTSKMAAKTHFNAQRWVILTCKSSLILLAIQNKQWKMALGHRKDIFGSKLCH